MFRVSINGIIADFAKMGNICKDLLKKCKAMEQPRSGPLERVVVELVETTASEAADR